MWSFSMIALDTISLSPNIFVVLQAQDSYHGINGFPFASPVLISSSGILAQAHSLSSSSRDMQSTLHMEVVINKCTHSQQPSTATYMI